MQFFVIFYDALLPFVVAAYTGIPISVTTILMAERIVVWIPDINSWLMITYRPLMMAMAGITGYRGTLYVLTVSGCVLRRRITAINVSV